MTAMENPATYEEAKPIYEGEPIGSIWMLPDFDKLLLWAIGLKASDVMLVPKNPVWVRLHGSWVEVTRRPVGSEEIEMLLDGMVRSNTGSSRIKGAEDVDATYEVRSDRFTVHLFRVNGTGCRDAQSSGASVVMRINPALPPKLADLDPEPAIIEHGFPDNGLVLATGVMGSGKSTLLASMLRHIRENWARHIISYESPIEFDLSGVPCAKGPCVQVEIPKNLSSFAKAPRNSTRRAVDVALYGEARDQETLHGMIEEAEIGVAVYSTVHTRSVAETPARILNVFPADMQNQVLATMLPSLRLIVQQRLVPRVDGRGRVALREILAFDAQMREKLMSTQSGALSLEIQKMVESAGQPLIEDATKKYGEGLISAERYHGICREFEK